MGVTFASFPSFTFTVQTLHKVTSVTRSNQTSGPGILACLPLPKAIIFVEETNPHYREIEERITGAGDDREKLKAANKFVLNCREQEEIGVLNLRLNDIENYAIMSDTENSVLLRSNPNVHITFAEDGSVEALKQFLKNKTRKDQ